MINWGFLRLSINQVIVSEGHSGFYTAFSLSLAVLFAPLFQKWFQIPSSGFGVEVDSIITVTAISGLITGLLFVTTPDRIADSWIEGKAKYISWREFKPFKKNRKCNQTLQHLIAEIDQTVSNWDRPTWISTSDNCFSIVEAAIDAQQIQKTLWELKRKAGVGVLFCMWSVTLWMHFEIRDLLVLFVVFVIGIVILFHTLFWGAATEIVSRVRKFAFINYTKDSLHSYQPIRYQRRDEAVLDAIERLKESVNVLEQVATSRQWKRFDALYDKNLYELRKMRPRIANSANRLTSAWFGTFANYYLSKSKGESVEEDKNWFLNVLETYIITGELEKLAWKIRPDANNYSDPEAVFSLQLNEVLTNVYREHDTVQSLLRKTFKTLTTEDKILWINGAAKYNHGFPQVLRNDIYSFACTYEGDRLSSESYEKLASTPGRIDDTTLFMLQRVYDLDISGDKGKDLKYQFFTKVVGSSNIDKNVGEKARLYRSHFKS